MKIPPVNPPRHRDHDLLTLQLVDKYGYWGEHPDFPVTDWQYEVDNNDTREGYWDWVYNQISNGYFNEEGGSL